MIDLKHTGKGFSSMKRLKQSRHGTKIDANGLKVTLIQCRETPIRRGHKRFCSTKHAILTPPPACHENAIANTLLPYSGPLAFLEPMPAGRAYHPLDEGTIR